MSDGPLSGEARHRASSRRRSLLFAVLMLAGAVVGFVFGLFDSDNDLLAGGSIPPGVAIALAVVTFIALTWGAVAYKRQIDEVVLRDNIYAGAWATFVVFVGYPVWFLLWKGGLVAEPSHVVMYGVLYVVTCAVYLYRKYR